MAPADRRAELVSSYLLACYFGNSLPVVGIAALSRYLGHAWANAVFAAVSTLLAIVALIVGSRYRGPQAELDASGAGTRDARPFGLRSTRDESRSTR